MTIHINQRKRTRNTSVSSAPGLLQAEVIGNYLSPLRTALLLWERVNRSLRVLKLPIRGGCLILGGGRGRTRSLPLLSLSTIPHHHHTSPLKSRECGGHVLPSTAPVSRPYCTRAHFLFTRTSLDGLSKKRGCSWSILLVFALKSISRGPTYNLGVYNGLIVYIWHSNKLPGGGYLRNFWVGVCHWDPGTLNLYQS